MREGVFHPVSHVHRERVTVHGPRARAVGTWRLAHEGRWRVGHVVADFMSAVGEGSATAHGDVVHVTHGRKVLLVCGLGKGPAALVARVGVLVWMVGGLLVMVVVVHIVGHVRFGHVMLVELLEKRAPRAWRRRVVVVVLAVHVCGGLDSVRLWGDAVLVVVFEEGRRDSNVDSGLEARRGIMEVV